MIGSTTKNVESLFLDVVEQLAFMFGEPCSPEELAGHGGWVRADIEFEGGVRGSIGLCVPADLCAEISANILGLDIDAEIPPEVARDSLKELLNVVSGHVVPALQSEQEDFVLGIPTLADLDEKRRLELVERPDVACFMLDGSPVMLVLAHETGRP